MERCVQCKNVEVAEEFTRCAPCLKEHQRYATELDSRPRRVVEKVREELFPIYEVKQGIKVTTWISREDATAMGIDVSKLIKQL